MAVTDKYWEEIHNIPSLSEEAERALAEKISQGDDKAVDKLVTSNIQPALCCCISSSNVKTR